MKTSKRMQILEKDENGCHRKESCKYLHRETQSNNVASPDDKNCGEEKDPLTVDSGCKKDDIKMMILLKWL